MEDPMRKSQKAFSDILQSWWNQWLQETLTDGVFKQYWAAANIGNSGNQSGGVDPYRILGLQKTDPDEQVKKRFRELVIKLHPDTAGVKGTEFLFQLVMAAYQQISKERGWS
jgi:DnaJ-domain-containing protein 1